MDIKEIADKVGQVSDTYAKNCDIQRDDDWYLLKLQEELGELTQQHLKVSKRARMSESVEGHKELLSEEVADVFAHVLLYAQKNNIDLEAALEKKWFSWLK